MDRRTKICIWVILIGLANFLAYSIAYTFIGGEAVNGSVVLDHGKYRYYLQSEIEVSRATFIYSGVHSISIWVTVAAIMLAMLTLAKERIASSMRSTIIRGRTLITVLATVISLATTVITIWFVLQFAHRLQVPREPRPPAREIRGVSSTFEPPCTRALPRSA
jgi:hypothetical protein